MRVTCMTRNKNYASSVSTIKSLVIDSSASITSSLSIPLGKVTVATALKIGTPQLGALCCLEFK